MKDSEILLKYKADLKHLDKLGKELVQIATDNCHKIVRLTKAF